MLIFIGGAVLIGVGASIKNKVQKQSDDIHSKLTKEERAKRAEENKARKEKEKMFGTTRIIFWSVIFGIIILVMKNKKKQKSTQYLTQNN